MSVSPLFFRIGPATGRTSAFDVVRIGLLTLLLTCLGCGSESEPEKPKNVILVTLDTTRPDYLGAWGRAGNPTPNLDGLATDGVRFANAVSSSAVTPVSHASILTGQHQYQHGLRILSGAGGFQLPETVPTLASALKSRGFSTAAFHSAFPVSAIYGFDRDFDVFEDVQGTGLSVGEEGETRWDVAAGQRRSDSTTEMVMEFVEATTGPFFIWIHYWDPHDAILYPPAEFLEGKIPAGQRNDPQRSSDLYGLEVSYVDAQFGRLLDRLKQRDLYQDTLFAVVADHGEGLADGLRKHGWPAHRILYQEQIHVPLILRVPGANKNKTVENLVSSVDIYPTILDYLDIAPEGELGGSSLRSLIEGEEELGRIAYADQINLWDTNAHMLARRPQADFLHVVMDDEWKLIYRPRDPQTSELYAYRKDVDEQQNLFGRRIDISKRMMIDLADRDPWVLTPPQEGGGMNSESMATLSDLGYTSGSIELSSEEIANMWEWLCPEAWHRLPQAGKCPDHQVKLLPARKKPLDGK